MSLQNSPLRTISLKNFVSPITRNTSSKLKNYLNVSLSPSVRAEKLTSTPLVKSPYLASSKPKALPVDKMGKAKVIERKSSNQFNLQEIMKTKLDEKRRSKRVRVESNEKACYEFEKIKDYKGNDLIVQSIVNKKKKVNTNSCPSQIKIENMPKASKTNERRKRASTEKVNSEMVAPTFCSLNSTLEKNEYLTVSQGVSVYMFSDKEDDGIIELSPKSETKTQLHDQDVLLVVRRGKVSVIMSDRVNVFKIGEVMKVPKNVKYRIANELLMSKSYVHFQFL